MFDYLKYKGKLLKCLNHILIFIFLLTCNSLNVGGIGTVGNVNVVLDDNDGGNDPSFGPYITPPNSDPLTILGEYGGNFDGLGVGSEAWLTSISLTSLRCVLA